MVLISKAAEKAKLSCVEIVHLILAGFLENVARLNGVEGYGAILVEPSEVRLAKARHLPGISASDAFARLKLPKRTGWELVGRSDAPRLQPVVIDSPNGQHRIFRFYEDHIAAFGSNYTTEVRVANANGIEKSEVLNWFGMQGVRPVLDKRQMGLNIYRQRDVPTYMEA